MLTPVLIVILVVVLFAAIPAWPHSRNWGYAPSGIVAAILAILLLLLVLGKI